MFVALVVVSSLLALVLTATGIGKLVGHSETIASLTAVGFPARLAFLLAAAELAGAVGLLVGLRWWPIGVAAACGVLAYFLGAIGAHLRARAGKVAPAVVLAIVAVITLVLRIATR